MKKPKIKITGKGAEFTWDMTTRTIGPVSMKKQLIVWYPDDEGISVGDGGGSSYRLSWSEAQALAYQLLQMVQGVG